MHFLSTLVAASSLVGSIAALPQASPPLPTAAFNLEGYAKNNPTAAVSGGAGGATTTVSASAGLQSAVKVRIFDFDHIAQQLTSISGHNSSEHRCKG